MLIIKIPNIKKPSSDYFCSDFLGIPRRQSYKVPFKFQCELPQSLGNI